MPTQYILEIYEPGSARNCWVVFQTAIAEWRVKYPNAKVKVTAETVWVWREEDPAATTMTMEYYCLPDTVGPRGPKGK